MIKWPQMINYLTTFSLWYSIPSILTVSISLLLIVVIKYNKLSLIKKKHKNKRELKTETRNDPLTTHTRSQTNTYKHWSRRPIRRSMPIGDDRQAPEQRRHNKEESQRQNHIHAQTQDHTKQTAECCHRGTTMNRHMIYPDTSNRIHPVQGGFHPSLHSILIFFSFISENCRQGLLYIRYRYNNPPKQKR